MLFDLRPNYGGGDEDDGDLLRKVPCSTAALSASNPAAGHRQPTPLLETPGHSQASGQSLVGSLLLSPGARCTQGFVSALQKSVSPVLGKSCVSSMVRLIATSSKRAYAIPRSTAPRALPPQQSTVDLYLCRRHSNTLLAQSLWGFWVLVCTRFV